MAGHSKFKNIQHRKGAQDKKRAKIFTRILREVSIAAKDSTNSDENPKLRRVILTAKAANIPADRIDYAIYKESKKDLSTYHEMQYEAFYPGGIGFIIEVSTDNKNRSSSDIRSVFNKYGGQMVETGNVSFMFDNRGIIIFEDLIEEEVENIILSLDVEDAKEIEEDGLVHYAIFTKVEKFHEILEKATELLKKSSIDAKLAWVPHSYISLSDEQNVAVHQIIDALENYDDVVNIFFNFKENKIEN